MWKPVGLQHTGNSPSSAESRENRGGGDWRGRRDYALENPVSIAEELRFYLVAMGTAEVLKGCYIV